MVDEKRETSLPRYIDANKIEYTDRIPIYTADGRYQIGWQKAAPYSEIDKIPTADVAPIVHGNWIPGFVKEHSCTMCSVCKKLLHLDAVFYPFAHTVGRKWQASLNTRKWKKTMHNLKQIEEQFQTIADISIDYDGYRKAEDLMRLIDELRDMATKGVGMVQEMEQRERDTLLHKKWLGEID